MKPIPFLIALLFPIMGFSQNAYILTNLNQNNSTFGYFDETSIELSGTNTLAIGTTGDYSLKAKNLIHIPPSTHISVINSTPATTKNFNAKICNNQLDAVILEPTNSNDVKMFSKVEFGVNLSNIPTLDTRIDAFLSDGAGQYKPGTAGYTAAYNNETIINPYDPQQISVEAVLYRPGSNVNAVVRHGFYFKKVDENDATKNWQNPLTPDTYEWRIRFAPDVTGTWTGYINVYFGSKLLIENKYVSFNVNPTTQPVDKAGFIEKGLINPRYLQYSSGSNHTYIPVGVSYATTQFHGAGDCNTLNCDGTIDHRVAYESYSELSSFVNLLTNQPTGNGGNSTRLLMCPWGFQIEFEKLGNYDSRQVEMSVMDKYINLLEAKNVKLILGQLGAEMVDEPTPAPGAENRYYDKWYGSPYNGIIGLPGSTYRNAKFKGIAGINSVADIFNPANPGYATALQMTKNRWRYIEARWGYSTAISTYELLTEVDGIGAGSTWYRASSIDGQVSDWVNKIAQSLKETEQTKHLTTASYMGEGVWLAGESFVSQMWNKPYIDMISAHGYSETEHADRHYLELSKNAKNQFPSKPFIFNEFDPTFYVTVPLCTDRALHNKLWSSMFSGSMGPGLSYINILYNIDIYSGPGQYAMPHASSVNYDAVTNYSGQFEKNYPSFLNFVEQIDFKNANYTSYATLQPAALPFYELIYMVKDPDKTKAYGWFHNRSFNSFANVPCRHNTDDYVNISVLRDNPKPKDEPDSRPNFDHYFRRLSPQDAGSFNPNVDNYVSKNGVTVFGSGYDPVSKSGENIAIENLLPNTLYDVNWVWTWGPNAGTNYWTTFSTSNSSGQLFLFAPPTGTIGGTLYPGDWAFKVIKRGARPTGIEEAQQNQIMVSPNPSNNIFFISGVNEEIHEKAEVRLFDVSGRLLFNETVADVNGYQLNLKDNDNGIYILKVTINGNERIIKLIKNAD